MTRRALLPYIIVFVLTALSRAVALWWIFPPLGWNDVGRGFELGQVAANMAEGRGMSSPFTMGDAPTSWFMPAVPILWALLFRLTGVFSYASLLSLYSLECVLAGASACCYLGLLRTMLPDGTKRTLPIVAVLVAALVPEHLVALTRPWYWGAQKLGVALMLICSLRWHRQPTFNRAATFGAISGLTLLVNSVPLLLFVALLAQSLLRSIQPRMARRSALVAISVSCLMLVPWVVRNYSVHGAFVPLRQNTWVEIRQGNNIDGSIIQGLDSLHPNVNEVERSRYAELGEHGYESLARTEALAYIASHPAQTAQRTALRAVFFWLSDLFHEGVYGSRSWGEKSLQEQVRDVVFFLVATLPLLLVVLAVVRGWLRRIHENWLLLTPLLVLPLPYYISHIHPTYFTSIKGLLIIVAVLGVGEARGTATKPPPARLPH